MIWKMHEETCVDITSEHTPDPWIYKDKDKYYLTFTGNNRVPMWDTATLMDFHDRPRRGPIWNALQSGPQSERLWAPELHCLQGRWYIYFAGADATIGNRSHRMYVLGGPAENENPHKGPWELLGAIKGMDQRQWAIDGTVFEIDGSLYFAYSGWPRRDDGSWEDRSEKVQQLFIMRLKDTFTADSEPMMISYPSNVWEQLPGTDIAINEGPQWLEAPSGRWRGLVYSCSASWTKHYKMATLRYLPAWDGHGPLDPRSWRKGDAPLIQNRPDGNGPYGPGHGCFLHEDGETFALFHATDQNTDGNRNRRCRMQRVRWTEKGAGHGRICG